MMVLQMSRQLKRALRSTKGPQFTLVALPVELQFLLMEFVDVRDLLNFAQALRGISSVKHLSDQIQVIEEPQDLRNANFDQKTKIRFGSFTSGKSSNPPTYWTDSDIKLLKRYKVNRLHAVFASQPVPEPRFISSGVLGEALRDSLVACTIEIYTPATLLSGTGSELQMSMTSRCAAEFYFWGIYFNCPLTIISGCSIQFRSCNTSYTVQVLVSEDNGIKSPECKFEGCSESFKEMVNLTKSLPL